MLVSACYTQQGGTTTPPTPPPPTAFIGVGGPVSTLASTGLVFPQWAQGAGWQTGFTFNNLGSTSTVVTVRYYSQAGVQMGSGTVSLAANGSGRFAISGFSALTFGWARATTSPSADISATETIQLFDGTRLVMETAVLPAIQDTTIRVPVYQRDGFGTGVAMVNTSSVAQLITLRVWNSSGAIVATGPLTLNSSEQTARFIGDLFPAVASNFEGMLEISANNIVAVTALRIELATGILSAFPVVGNTAEVYFSPDANTVSRIVSEFASAQRTIDVAIYSFTRDQIADALIAARGRGVTVRIIADTVQSSGTGSDIARLEGVGAGVSVKRTNGGSGGIMHHKYAVIDGRLVITGSYNWSDNAEENNDENALFLRDSAIVNSYQANFNSMWAR